MHPTAQAIIEKLKLEPLPEEGGFFREVYRSSDSTLFAPRYQEARTFYTSIYFLMTPLDFSALHRVKSDELFYFHLGDPVEMTWLLPNGEHRQLLLGADPLKDHHPQICVPHGVWQGTRLLPGGEFALLSCAVVPGFEYADFELADRAACLASHPAAADAILALTR